MLTNSRNGSLGFQDSVPFCLYLDENLDKCVFWGIYLAYVWISLWLFFYQARLLMKETLKDILTRRD